jgi:hypothetical protein
VTIATGRKGTTFDYFGERYRARFARAGVELDIRETNGALENLRLLRDRDFRSANRVLGGRHLQQHASARFALDGNHFQCAILGFLFLQPIVE